MGNTLAPCPLTKEELQQLTTETVFSTAELRALWQHFDTISAHAPQISRGQFQAAMLCSDSPLIDQIFRVFDSNDDDQISYNEYVRCLSIISNKASKEDKHMFSFKLYDFDGDGMISAEDLTAVLASTLRENGLVITREQIDAIVVNTMNEVSPAVPGKIAYDEYKALDSKQPLLLSHLSMNISGIIKQFSSTNGLSFSTPRHTPRASIIA